MFWQNKKKKCEHDWHELATRKENEYFNTGWSVDVEQTEYTYIYCPRCDSTEKIRPSEWVLKRRAQEIKQSYAAK